MSISRRALLRGLGATAGATLAAAALPHLGLRPLTARAAGGPLKFCFVFNPGGWDVTQVFAPAFDLPGVHVMPGSQPGLAGGIPFVDHPTRPAVRAFFEAWGSRSLVLNGILVRSIAHEICTEIAMTGSTGGSSADWPTRIGAASANSTLLPSLVLAGPSFPADRVDAVARTGRQGQLQALIDGRALQASDLSVQPLSRPEEGLVDRYVLARARGRALVPGGSLDQGLSADVVRALEKTADLKDLQYAMQFTTGPSLDDQAAVAAQALSRGVSRCVTLSFAGAQQVLGWDTHANNDAQQSQLFQELFQGLGQLMQRLRQTPGETTPSLADETVVVVLSEMARTPALNGLDGRDHWPHTSALLIGPGITGGRVVGGFDELFYGRPVDPDSAEIGGSTTLSAESLGATLLALADQDPAEALPGIEPLWGVLA